MSPDRKPTLRKTERAIIVGLVTNVALAAVKMIAGLLGHSYALVADAIESMTDIFGSVVIWSGVKIAARPADENHPYGHGRAETLASLIVSAMIFFAGIGIMVKSVSEIITPHHAPAPFTLIVLLVVVVVKEFLFRRVIQAANEAGSGAVHVDAWHHRSDAITSLAAFIGITVALIGGEGWEMADDVGAIIASFVILYNAFKLFREPVRELMDEEPGDIVEESRRVAASVPRVQLVEKTTARKVGSRYWIDMHVQVDPTMPVVEAHDVAHRVKDAVRAALPRVDDVLIHIEPFGVPPVPLAPPPATPPGALNA